MIPSIFSASAAKRDQRAETCMQRPGGLPGGRGEGVRCVSHPCSPRHTGLDRRPAAQRLVLRNRICNTKWSFFQSVSLEKLRPEHPAEVKGRFWSARGGGPGLGRTDPRSWEGSGEEPWPVAFVLSLFDPWEVPHVDFLCPPPPPTMVLNQDSSLGGKCAQPSLQEGSWPHRSGFTSQ